MAFNFPKVQLSEHQLLWMREVYSRYKEGREIEVTEIKLTLYRIIPNDFSPYSIDERLLRHGTRITLLGILHLDPNTDLVIKADKIIPSIRDLLLADHSKKYVGIEEIAQLTNITRNEVARTLNLVGELGNFGVDRMGDVPHRVSAGYENTVTEYLSYKGLEPLILRFYKSKDRNIENDQNNPLNVISSSSLDNTKLAFKPIFHSKITHVDLKLCFALMPFSEKWSNRVYELIRKIVEKIGLQCLRADNLTGPIIIEDIWTKINQCAFIIADVTNKNPNVMYEIGIAHTIGKPTILLTQDMTNVPFDFAHLRHHGYEDNIDGFASLSEKLPQIIKEIYREHYSQNSNIVEEDEDDDL